MTIGPYPDAILRKTGQHNGHIEDGNDDGDGDLMLHFPMQETGFTGDESEGKLVWERTETGEHGLSGTDSVTFVE